MENDLSVGGSAPGSKEKAFGFSRGQRVGAGLGTVIFLLAYGAASGHFGPQRHDELVVLWGGFCGEVVGRIVELRRQGRAAEVIPFWSSRLAMVPLLAMMTFAGIFGDRLFGGPGRFVGLVGVPLLAAILNRLYRWLEPRVKGRARVAHLWDTRREEKAEK